jgi:mRNA-degrading endonuclease RelE of RelBE toxin-antitoxin system
MATTIGRLETDRSIAEPLRGPLKGKFCVKEHPYRIILSIDSEARKVYIEDVGPRGDIYKK